MEQYRVDQYGTVYEYDEKRNAYVCIGKKLPGESDEDAIDRILMYAEFDEN
jgi:hypothetical protein